MLEHSWLKTVLHYKRLRDVSTDTEKQLKSRITELEKETSGNGRLRGWSYVSAREL